MKLREEIKPLIKKRETMHALENQLNKTSRTIYKWLKKDPSPFYESPAIRRTFLKIVGKTINEAFEPSQTEQETK
jgi:hypothetical protein